MQLSSLHQFMNSFCYMQSLLKNTPKNLLKSTFNFDLLNVIVDEFQCCSYIPSSFFLLTRKFFIRVMSFLKCEVKFSETWLFGHLYNPFPCLIRHWFPCPFRRFTMCFTLFNPTLCQFQHKISLPVHVGLNGFHCNTYRKLLLCWVSALTVGIVVNKQW